MAPAPAADEDVSHRAANLDTLAGRREKPGASRFAI
jgi:hypothetical protein